jgi:hypothetical protein
MFLRIACGCVLLCAACAGVALKFHATAASVAAQAAAPPPDLPPDPTLAYTIKLARPAKVGDTYYFVGDATLVRSGLANLAGYEKTLGALGLSLHIEATERVEAVRSTGELARVSYKVAKCTFNDGKRSYSPVFPGATLTVAAGQSQSVLHVSFGTLQPNEAVSLRTVLALPNLGDVSADDTFGSPGTHKVGASWPANSAALAKWVSREGLEEVAPADVSGTVVFKGLQTVNGVQCALVQGRAVVKSYVPEIDDLPNFLKPEAGSYELKTSRLVPLDPTVGLCLTDSHSDRCNFPLRIDRGSLGTDSVIDVKVIKTVGIKRTPIRVAGLGPVEQ